MAGDVLGCFRTIAKVAAAHIINGDELSAVRVADDQDRALMLAIERRGAATARAYAGLAARDIGQPEQKRATGKRSIVREAERRTVDALRREGAAKVTRITENTRANIRKILATSRRDNLTNRETAKRISTEIGGDRMRATTIARTETHSAGQRGEFEAYSAAGVKVKKEWGSTEDGRTRPDHAAADGQLVEMDEPFIVGGEELRFPGDPQGSARNIINCRCVTLYRPVKPDPDRKPAKRTKR